MKDLSIIQSINGFRNLGFRILFVSNFKQSLQQPLFSPSAPIVISSGCLISQSHANGGRKVVVLAVDARRRGAAFVAGGKIGGKVDVGHQARVVKHQVRPLQRAVAVCGAVVIGDGVAVRLAAVAPRRLAVCAEEVARDKGRRAVVYLQFSTQTAQQQQQQQQ